MFTQSKSAVRETATENVNNDMIYANKCTAARVLLAAVFLYTENHSLGEWFKRSLMAIMLTVKTPFAKMEMRSANCIKESKGRS